MVTGRVSRRRFLEGTLASAGLGMMAQQRHSVATNRPKGANDRLSVGMVGTGDRGTGLMQWIHQLSASDNVEITAVCDIWRQRREAAAELVLLWNQREPRKCRTMAEICELKDVDVLFIATPDFQHALHARQAVEAGKDVYTEKPFGCDFQQIKMARDAVKKSGRIFQSGTQRRSDGISKAGQEFIQSDRLGKITYIEASQSLFQQRWRIPGSEVSIKEQDTNWKEFLSYTPEVPFNPRFYREFRLFWPYSYGVFSQWMSHVIDQVHMIMGEAPMAVTAAGGIFLWHDGRNNPDTAQCLLEYPGGYLVSYHMRLGNGADTRELMFYGTQGTLDLNAGVAYGDKAGGEVILRNPGSYYPEYVVDAAQRLPDRDQGGLVLKVGPSKDHVSDFFSAVRARKQPCADIDSAFTHALATIMAGLSLHNGVRVEYDADKDVLYPKELMEDLNYPTSAAAETRSS